MTAVRRSITQKLIGNIEHMADWRVFLCFKFTWKIICNDCLVLTKGYKYLKSLNRTVIPPWYLLSSDQSVSKCQISALKKYAINSRFGSSFAFRYMNLCCVNTTCTTWFITCMASIYIHGNEYTLKTKYIFRKWFIYLPKGQREEREEEASSCCPVPLDCLDAHSACGWLNGRRRRGLVWKALTGTQPLKPLSQMTDVMNPAACQAGCVILTSLHTPV